MNDQTHVELCKGSDTRCGQIADAGPAAFDSACVFGSADLRPANVRENGAGVDVSPTRYGRTSLRQVDEQEKQENQGHNLPYAESRIPADIDEDVFVDGDSRDNTVGRGSSFRADRLIRNSLMLIASIASISAFGFIFWFVIARTFPPEQVGTGTTLITATTTIAFLSVCGFNTTIMRFHTSARKPNALITWGILVITIVGGLISSAYVLLVPVFEPALSFVRSNVLYGVGFIGASVLAGISLLTESVFIGARKPEYHLILNGPVRGLAKVVAPFVLIGLGGYGIFGAVGFGYFVCVTASLLCMRRVIAFRFDFRSRGALTRQHVGYSGSTHLAALFTMVPVMIFPLIALHALGEANTGYYNVTFQVASMVYAISTSVGEALLSEGSFNQSRLPTLLRRSALLLMALILPAVVVLTIASGSLLRLFGKSYADHAQELLVVFAIGAFVVTVNTWSCFLLKLTGQMRSLIAASAIFAAVAIGFAELWAPRGLVWFGAAWIVGNAAGLAFAIAALVAYHRRRNGPARDGRLVSEAIPKPSLALGERECSF
jgi:O-antigen/teichoic acid export membrane protein